MPFVVVVPKDISDGHVVLWRGVGWLFHLVEDAVSGGHQEIVLDDGGAADELLLGAALGFVQSAVPREIRDVRPSPVDDERRATAGRWHSANCSNI